MSAGSTHSVINEFAVGLEGSVPSLPVLGMVDRIVRAALEKNERTDCSVDDDGSLYFETPVRDGLFLMCNIDVGGNIDASLHEGPAGRLIEYLPQATEEQLTSLF